MSSPTTTTYGTAAPLASPRSIVNKKQKMSITQTYFLAHKARAKLSNEAAMPDHNLRLLVGHANLLDSLMLELADAEREQESWFNQSVRNASQTDNKTTATATTTESRHIQWADSIAEEEEEDEQEDEEDDYDLSSDDGSDMSSDEDVEMADVEVVSLRRVPSNNSHSHSNTLKAPASPQLQVVEVDMEDFEEDEYDNDDDDDEDYAQLTLTRTHSHHSVTSPPPELEHDTDESSEDESMPPSPPSTMLPTFEQPQQMRSQHKGIESPMANTADFFDDSIHYLPTAAAAAPATARSPATLVSAISVY